MDKSSQEFLEGIYAALAAHYGALGWWPAETGFEICIGAILTQNTAWNNVEKAIAALKRAQALDVQSLQTIDTDALAQLIRPAGFHNLKSRRLKTFTAWLCSRYQGSLANLFAHDWHDVRVELLSVAGIGPETADAILLYAGGKPTFVVDAYTKRLYERLGLLSGRRTYEQVRSLFMENLPPDSVLFQEYHALIVEHCKLHCRKQPRCGTCPLAEQCCCRIS